MTNRSLTYGDEKFEYQIFFRERPPERVAIHVYPNGSVQVDAMHGIALDDVHRAVQKRARWIKRNLDEAKRFREHALPREYVSGETHFYLGRRYQLKLVQSQAGEQLVKLSRGRLDVSVALPRRDRVKSLLKAWYRQHAEIYLGRRIGELTEQVPWLDQPPEFKLLAMRKQWGSCSPNRSIILSPALVKAPRDCIDYVILHELCHLREHNHSRRYYDLLTSLMPEWKPVKAKLDGMAELLLAE